MKSMPDSAAMLAALREFLATRFDIPEQSVEPGTALRDLGLDSMMVMDVMLETEDRFGIKLNDLALPRDPTVGDVIALVHRNLAAAT